MIYHIEQNGIQTQAYRRLGCRPDFVVKRLEIFHLIFNRDSWSHAFSDRIIFCCSSCRADPRHYFNRVWLQSMPGTSHIEVAIHPSQQEIRNFNGGRSTKKRISKSMFRGAIAQPTSFKLCRMVQTYMLGMEPQGVMSKLTYRVTHTADLCAQILN